MRHGGNPPEHNHKGNGMWAPAIPFFKKEDNKERKTISMKLPLDPSKPHGGKDADKGSNIYTKEVYIFEDGTPEEWCVFKQTVTQLLIDKGITAVHPNHHTAKQNIIKSMMAGKTRELLDKELNKLAEKPGLSVPSNKRRNLTKIEAAAWNTDNDGAIRVQTAEEATEERVGLFLIRALNYIAHKQIFPDGAKAWRIQKQCTRTTSKMGGMLNVVVQHID